MDYLTLPHKFYLDGGIAKPLAMSVMKFLIKDALGANEVDFAMIETLSHDMSEFVSSMPKATDMSYR